MRHKVEVPSCSGEDRGRETQDEAHMGRGEDCRLFPELGECFITLPLHCKSPPHFLHLKELDGYLHNSHVILPSAAAAAATKGASQD